MTRLFLCAALAVTLAVPALAQTDASRVPDDAPAWLPMEEAIAKAQAEDKLLLVHTYAVWCGWCARMDQEVYTDDAVQAYLAEHFVGTRVNLESEEEVPFFATTVSMARLGIAFGVTGTPTTVFVDPSGELITKLPGFADAETFGYALHFVREGAYATMGFREYVDQQRGVGMPALPQAAPDVVTTGG